MSLELPPPQPKTRAESSRVRSTRCRRKLGKGGLFRGSVWRPRLRSSGPQRASTNKECEQNTRRGSSGFMGPDRRRRPVGRAGDERRGRISMAAAGIALARRLEETRPKGLYFTAGGLSAAIAATPATASPNVAVARASPPLSSALSITKLPATLSSTSLGACGQSCASPPARPKRIGFPWPPWSV